MFKEKFIEQLKKFGTRFEIENEKDNTIYVWDNDEQHATYYKFDNNGDLIDIY